MKPQNSYTTSKNAGQESELPICTQLTGLMASKFQTTITACMTNILQNCQLHCIYLQVLAMQRSIGKKNPWMQLTVCIKIITFKYNALQRVDYALSQVIQLNSPKRHTMYTSGTRECTLCIASLHCKVAKWPALRPSRFASQLQ